MTPAPERPPLAGALRLDGRHALVTGAARGIGRAIVERLLEAGATVTAVDLEPRPGGLGGPDAALAWRRGDVRDPDVAAEVVDGLPALSVLVNNAGTYPLVPWSDVDAAVWAQAMDTNLTSVARYSQLAARRMTADGTAGAIVNVSSVAGIRPVPMLVHYGVAKAGVRQLTRALAAEYGRLGIRVNTVTPGGIPTAGAARAAAGAAGAPAGTFASRPRPLGDTGTADDVALAVLYFASSMSRYVTGAELVVDGGLLVT